MRNFDPYQQAKSKSPQVWHEYSKKSTDFFCDRQTLTMAIFVWLTKFCCGGRSRATKQPLNVTISEIAMYIWFINLLKKKVHALLLPVLKTGVKGKPNASFSMLKLSLTPLLYEVIL